MTVAEALIRATARLAAAGCPAARLDARLLLADALGVAAERLLLDPDRPLAPDAGRRLERRIARRERREPVARILRSREFWSLDFHLSTDTLDPRPDSETLVETALGLVDRAAPLDLLDLGTGTGCLLLALLSELPDGYGLGLDVAPGAVRTATLNARKLGLEGRVRFRRGDWRLPGWTRGLTGRFDLVIANPPYIATAVLAGLDPEVGFDPRRALDGGTDGLDPYRLILPALPLLLRRGGVACLEIGYDQADRLSALAQAHNIHVDKIVRDLGNNDRVLVLRPVA